MTIDYLIEEKVMIRMDDYVDNLLSEARENMGGVSSSPAAEHMYEANEKEPELINEAYAQYFHTMAAKLLFLSKRERPDLQKIVEFLTARVKKLDRDDYKKLGRVFK